MVDELAPLPEEVGGAGRVGDRAGLGDHEVADLAPARPVLAGGRSDAVLVVDRGQAQQRDAGASPVGVGAVVAAAVDGAVLGHCGATAQKK